MPRICQMVYHQGNCLNKKKSFTKDCKLCLEACPHKAIDAQYSIKSARCTECGLCMAICPSDGFVDHLIDQLHTYVFSAQEIMLHCPGSFSSGFEISCLGMLDRDLWSVLMVMGCSKTVSIFTGDCSECTDRLACVSSVRTLKELLKDWPDKPNITIKVKPDRRDNKERNSQVKLSGYVNEVSKPTVDFKEQSRQAIFNLLPGMKSSEIHTVPLSRQWLIEALSTVPELKAPIVALIVNEKCTVCGLCEAVCPQGALSQQEVSGQKRLILEPYKCVQCNRCIEICRSKAISRSIKMLTYHTLTHKILLYERAPVLCHQCGRIVLDNSQPPICVSCALGKSDQRDLFI